MQRKLITVTIIISLCIFMLIVYRCYHSDNISSNIDAGETEKNTQGQLISDALSNVEGLNGGPKPTWFVEPIIKGIDSIPVTQTSQSADD